MKMGLTKLTFRSVIDRLVIRNLVLAVWTTSSSFESSVSTVLHHSSKVKTVIAFSYIIRTKVSRNLCLSNKFRNLEDLQLFLFADQIEITFFLQRGAVRSS